MVISIYGSKAYNRGMQGSQGGIADEMAGGLCYILGPLSGALFLFWGRYRENRFVRFHAWQSIFFSLGGLLLITLTAGTSVLLPLEYVSLAMFATFGWMLVLTPLWFYAMLQALNAKEWNLPLAGTMARACR